MNKLYLSLFLAIILSISFVSAFEFDNVVKPIDIIKGEDLSFDSKVIPYNPIWDKYAPVKIDNAFGLGSTLLEGYISKHTDICSSDCQSEFILKTNQEGALIDGIYFYDANTREEVNLDYKIYIKTGEKVVDDYSEKCVKGKVDLLGNQTYAQICSQQLVGNHSEDILEEYRIGESRKAEVNQFILKASKPTNQKIDWVIKTQGKTLDDWAVWNASYNVGLRGYYTLNETTGNIAKNSVGGINGTNVNSLWNVTSGLIGTSLQSNASSWLNVSGDAQMLQQANTTINFWIYPNLGNCGGAGYGNILTFGSSAGGVLDFVGSTCELRTYFVGGGGQHLTGVNATSFKWNMVTMQTTDGGHVKIYLNGSLIQDTTGNTWNSNAVLGFGRNQFVGEWLDGEIDEVGIWNRTLSTSEILDIYNNGTGMTYSLGEINITVTPSYPINYFNQTTTPLQPIACNFTSIGQNISSVRLNVYNFTNVSAYTNTDSLGAGVVSYNKTWTTTSLINGNYTWACYGYGGKGVNASTGNRTFQVIINASTPTNISLIPVNNSYLNYTSVTLRVDYNQSSRYPIIVDRTGANNGTATNVTINSTFARWGNGGAYFGNNSVINGTKRFQLNLSDSSNLFTLSMWIKMSPFYEGLNGTAYFRIQPANAGGFSFRHGAGNGYNLLVNYGNGTSTIGSVTLTGDYTVYVGSYNHWLLTYNGTALKTYVNSALITTNNNILDIKLNSTEQPYWFIGGSNSPTTYLPAFLNASIDEVRLLNKSVSQAEITSLYTSNTIADTTGLVAYYDFEEGIVNGTLKVYKLGNSLCYQESANTTNQVGTDGSCELNYSGSYINTSYFLYINYSKPINSVGAIWQVKHGNDTEANSYNVTILNSCFLNSNVLQLRFYSDADYMISYGQCYNGTWINITQILNNFISDTDGIECSSCGDKSKNIYDGNWGTFVSYFPFGSPPWDIWKYDIHMGGGTEYVNNSADIYEEGIYWNISNTPILYNETFVNNSGGFLSSFFEVVISLVEGAYTWFYELTDDLNNYLFSENNTLTIDLTNPNITILSPPYLYQVETANQNITFNYSIQDTNINTCWYYNDNDFNNVTLNCLSNATFLYPSNHPDNLTLYLYGNDSAGNEQHSTRFFGKNTTAPDLSIISPSGNLGLKYANYNITINYSVTSTRPMACSYNSTFNSTMTYTPCNITNITNVPNSGQQTLYIYANDSLNNLAVGSSNFYPVVLVNNESYNLTSYETSIENILINISYDNNSYSSITGYLVYNNISYLGSKSNGRINYIFNSNITTPLTNGTLTIYNFYWNFILTNSTGSLSVNSTTNTQTINPIIFGICGGDNNVTYLNFTIKDQLTSNTINATFRAFYQIYTSLGVNKRNVTYEDLSEQNSSFAFCAYPSYKSYLLDGQIIFANSAYAQNTYYLYQANISNQTNNITLYLLNDSSATLTVLNLKDSSAQPISDAYIYIQRYDPGTDTYYLVSIAKTNYIGEDLVYLNWYDTLYKFIILKNGQNLLTTSPYKISSSPQQFKISYTHNYIYDKFKDIQYSLTFNNITDNFILTYVMSSSLVTSGCLIVDKIGVTETTNICNTCDTSASATLYCNIGSAGNGTFVAKFRALGSSWDVDLLTIQKFSSDLFNEMGNEDATFYALIFGGLIMAMFLITPVLAIFGMLIGLILGMVMGFTPINFAELIGIGFVGGIVIWALKR